jgi:hypothetical protein
MIYLKDCRLHSSPAMVQYYIDNREIKISAPQKLFGYVAILDSNGIARGSYEHG